MIVNQLLKCYSSSSSQSDHQEDEPMTTQPPALTAPSTKKKLFSIKGALDLIEHDQGTVQDLEEQGNKRQMKLSRKEEEMMGSVKSKMRFAGETYHRVAAPQVEISL